MNKLLLKNSIYYTLGEVLPKVLSLFLLPFYARIFTPKDFGILAYTNSIIVFLPVFCTLCLNSYILRFYYECKNSYEKKSLIGNLFLFIAIISTIVFVFGFFYFPIFLNFYKVQVNWNPYFMLAFISFYFEMFSIIPNVYLRVTQNAKCFFIVNFTKVVIQYILILIFIFKLNLGLYGFYLGNLIAIVIFSFVYFRIIYSNANFVINFQQIVKALKFSLPLCPAAFAYLVISFSDRLVLEQYVSLYDLGIYSIAFTISFATNMFVNGIYKAIEPELFKRISTEGFDVFLVKVSKIFYFFVFFIASLISFFSIETLNIVVGKVFFSSSNYIQILIIGVILLSINLFLGGLLTIKKSTKILGITNLIGVIVIIFCNLTFIPIYGINAACFSLVFSYLIMNIIMAYFTKDFKINILSPYLAIIILIIFNSITLKLFKNDFSFFIIFIKSSLLLSYLIIVKFILKINITDLLRFFKIKSINV